MNFKLNIQNRISQKKEPVEMSYIFAGFYYVNGNDVIKYTQNRLPILSIYYRMCCNIMISNSIDIYS